MTGGANFELIKRAAPIRDVVEMLTGSTVDRHGFCRCPFHNEKTASLKIYPDTNSFYCFGCHASGDVIDFTARATNKSPKEAAALLSELFHLNGNRTSRTAQKALNEAQRRREAAQKREAGLDAAAARVRAIRRLLDDAKAAFKAEGRPIEHGGGIGYLAGQLEQAEFEYEQLVEHYRNDKSRV